MIFFDLDGTLLDHETSEYLAVKEFYSQNKAIFNYNEDEFYKLWCKLAVKYFNKYLRGELTFIQQRIKRIKDLYQSEEIELSDAEAKEEFKVYLQNYRENWQPYKDVIPCLKRLQNSYRLGIITNGNQKQQLLKLEKIRVKEFFEIVVTAGEVGAAKPDKKIFKTACKRGEIQSENCYYIGDNLKTDILGCQKMNMNGVWLNREGKEKKLDDVMEIKSLEELREERRII